jgi:nitroreductase
MVLTAYEAIVGKRDTRNFSPRPIPLEVLNRILQAGRMAGSSKNTQPVRFVVLQEPGRKSEIAACGQFAGHVPHCAAAIAVVLTPGGGPFDAGRAAQNVMVAAWAEGITSCPTSMHDQECARRVLGLPADHTVATLLAMGYPDPAHSLHGGRQRLPLDAIVHWERWQER